MNRLLATATALILSAAPAVAQTAAEQRPTLVVAVVVDQFSANLFNHYRPWFTGGLRTLADQGQVYINGYQSHGVTVTCAGHSTVLTGEHPTHTGIPANDWIDTATGEKVYCLAAPGNTLAHGRNTDNGPVGPQQMTATTLGDWIKAGSPDSRVFAVSGKDRGAIALGGQHADGAFWFTEGFGLTTWVGPEQTAEARLAPVVAFNASLAARFAATPPAWPYQHERCRALAADWTIEGQAFRSDLPPADFEPGESPILDEMTLDAATMLLNTQQLGARGVTDVLGVSLSGTDHIGHHYGTQGPEMCEQLLRLDTALGAFLEAVERVPGGALVVLTADHGGSDFPERMAAGGNAEARRTDPAMMRRINGTLRDRFGLDADPVRSSAWGLIVVDKDRRALAEPLRAQVVAAAVDLLNAEPDVALAVARDELLAEPVPTETNPEQLSLRQRMRLSVVAGRSPDILRAYQPFVNGAGEVGRTIASHGSPWDYDRRVPIIFWRPDGEGQERFWPLRTVDIAPSLAAAIGVPAPAGLDGRCIDLDGPGGVACPVAP